MHKNVVQQLDIPHKIEDDQVQIKSEKLTEEKVSDDELPSDSDEEKTITPIEELVCKKPSLHKQIKKINQGELLCGPRDRKRTEIGKQYNKDLNRKNKLNDCASVVIPRTFNQALKC